MNLTDIKPVYAFLSKNILSLCDYEVDAEMLFTLSIYLKMLAIKSSCSPADLKAFTTVLLNRAGGKVSPGFTIEENSLDGLYNANKELLSEIKAEVWSGRYNAPLQWLPEWEALCSSVARSGDAPEEIGFFLLHVIDEQLEITPDHALIVLSLIYKSVDN